MSAKAPTDDPAGKRPKRTPHGTKRVVGGLFIAAALAVLYYVNMVLPESALVSGSKRPGVRGARSEPARSLTTQEVDAILERGPPTGVGDPLDPPREPNTAICNESVLEGVMSVARQQTDRATLMYEAERKRREDQDKQLEAANRRIEELENEVKELKNK